MTEAPKTDPRNARDKWKEYAREALEAVMAANKTSYEQLQEKLTSYGEYTTVKSLRGKVVRGEFTMWWFMKCCMAMGGETPVDQVIQMFRMRERNLAAVSKTQRR